MKILSGEEARQCASAMSLSLWPLVTQWQDAAGTYIVVRWLPPDTSCDTMPHVVERIGNGIAELAVGDSAPELDWDTCGLTAREAMEQASAWGLPG